MNRKERRAAERAGRGGTARAGAMSQALPEIDAAFGQAFAYHRAGQLAAAENAYRQILAVAPRHARTLHYLGVIAHQTGRSDLALELIERAIDCDAAVPEFHYNLGVVLEALKRLDEAAAKYRRAIALNPNHANAQLNLGNILIGLNRLEEAEAQCRIAVTLSPGAANARYNLGVVLARLHRFDEAIAEFGEALRQQPNHSAAHAYLGAAYVAIGDLERAEDHCRRSLAIDPRNHQAAVHLGLTCLGKADFKQALELALHALDTDETPQARYLFSRAARHAWVNTENPQFRKLLQRALAERWERPSHLMRPAVSLIKLNKGIRAMIEPQSPGMPSLSIQALRDDGSLAEIASDRLLRELLQIAPVCDAQLEQVLTALRRFLLDLATDDASPAGSEDELAFFCALAQQCFCNEYVYALAENEQERADGLGRRLNLATQDGKDIPALWVAAVGAYTPLYTLGNSADLLKREWPVPVSAVLRQQITEPDAQRALRESMPNLTPVEDRTSIEVKRQYEENPYPRWIVAGAAAPAMPIDAYLMAKFQHVAYQPLTKQRIEVLVAGCGTGQHAIETARRLLGADILAVDLSAASLSYALYKTRELGLTGIQYAVADILKLDTLGRSFDVIEAQGVLHHLADPLGAWRRLLSILRPGGLMNVGLYSELARQSIVRARAFIAEHGYPASVDGIRRCRKDMRRSDDPLLKGAMETMDFFTISECRDLLFHVQEHRMTLPQIAAFIDEVKVTFLGFEADSGLFKAYEARFPEDKSKTDLACWHQFEVENPRSFAGMYQFWIQKPPLSPG